MFGIQGISRCTYYNVNLLLLAEYSEIFNHLDPGSTGSLSRDELVIALRLAGHNPTKDEIDQLLAHKQGKDMSFLLISVFSSTEYKKMHLETDQFKIKQICQIEFLKTSKENQIRGGW